MEVRLLYDCSHNSIYPETIGGGAVWVHRHNACHACPSGLLDQGSAFYETGTPVLLPGTNRVSSYICAARAGAAATHYSVDHGLGALQGIAANGGARRIGDGHVRLFHYDREMPVSLPLLADDAVSAAVSLLHGADIIQPVVRLKPLATLKGPKSKVV
jgi:tRNA-splicing ligase RtcB